MAPYFKIIPHSGQTKSGLEELLKGLAVSAAITGSSRSTMAAGSVSAVLIGKAYRIEAYSPQLSF